MCYGTQKQYKQSEVKNPKSSKHYKKLSRKTQSLVNLTAGF